MSLPDPTTLAIKAAVVSSAGLVVLTLLRNQRAALRAAVAAATFAGLLALPFAGRMWPAVGAPVPTIIIPEMRSRLIPAATLGAIAETHVPNRAPIAVETPSSIDVATVALYGWLLGAMILLSRVLVGWRSTRQLVRESRVAAPDWQRASRDNARRLNLTRDVVVLEHDELTVPITANALDPVIIVPSNACAWSDARRDLVLAHELAHVRRRDCFVDYIARVACAIYWFVPMVWRLASHLRLDRERSCDDVVLALGVMPPDYAEHLVDLATVAHASTARPLHAAALAMAPIGSLESRVHDILASDRRRGAMSRAGRFGVAIVSMAILVPISALAPHMATPGAFVLRGPVDTLDRPIGVNESLVWRGSVAAGSTISLRANMGDISVDSAATNEVVIIAQRRASASSSPADTRMVVITGSNGLAACSVYVDPARGRSSCETDGEWGRTSVENNDVSLRVRVPPGVHLRVQAGNGSVRVADHHGNVHVLDGNGNVNVSNNGTADLTTYTGALTYTRVGTGDSGPVALRVLHGEISANLSHGASVDAVADTGIVTLSARNLSTAIRTDHFKGPVLGGGSPLVARVQKGTIHIAAR